jgi:hypothetical protein
MNFVTLAFGILLIGTGFVTLVRKLHDRSIQESLAQVQFAHGHTAPAISAFVSLFVPIVSAIAGGIAFLVVGVMGRAAAPMSWLGW